MNPPKFQKHPITPTDLPALGKLSVESGLVESVTHLPLYYTCVDTDKWQCIKRADTGEIVSFSISHTIAPRVVSGSLVYTKPEYRNARLISMYNWHEQINYDRSAVLGLDMPDAMKYLVTLKTPKIFTWQARGLRGVNISAKLLKQFTKTKLDESKTDNIVNIRAATSNDLEQIAVYDDMVTGFCRTRFLRAWLFAPGHTTLIATSRDDQTHVTGYACMYACERGYGIMPLYADSEPIAIRLLLSAFDVMLEGAKREKSPFLNDIFMPILTDKTGFYRTCVQAGLKPVPGDFMHGAAEGNLDMCRRVLAKIDPAKMFGIHFFWPC